MFLTDPPPVQAEVDVAFAISANSVNNRQTFRLMKDTIKWIIGKYGTDKLQYSVILFGADAVTELNFGSKVSTPNVLIQLVQGLSRRSGEPHLDKALEEARKAFQSAGVRPNARKVMYVVLAQTRPQNQISPKFPNLCFFFYVEEQIELCKSIGKVVSSKWSHHRISNTRRRIS